jgi:hypothetical protein
MEDSLGNFKHNLGKLGEGTRVATTIPRGTGVQKIPQEQVFRDGCSSESTSTPTF